MKRFILVIALVLSNVCLAATVENKTTSWYEYNINKDMTTLMAKHVVLYEKFLKMKVVKDNKVVFDYYLDAYRTVNKELDSYNIKDIFYHIERTKFDYNEKVRQYSNEKLTEELKNDLRAIIRSGYEKGSDNHWIRARVFKAFLDEL